MIRICCLLWCTAQLWILRTKLGLICRYTSGSGSALDFIRGSITAYFGSTALCISIGTWKRKLRIWIKLYWVTSPSFHLCNSCKVCTAHFAFNIITSMNPSRGSLAPTASTETVSGFGSLKVMRVLCAEGGSFFIDFVYLFIKFHYHNIKQLFTINYFLGVQFKLFIFIM